MIGMRRFDTADRAEIDALPRAVRRAVIADRKRRVTAAIERGNAAGLVSPLRPRADVIAGVNSRSRR